MLIPDNPEHGRVVIVDFEGAGYGYRGADMASYFSYWCRDFEKIMEVFESTADRHAPFAAVDNTVIVWDVMEFALKQEVDVKVQAFAKDVYEYWKTRRQSSGNRPLQRAVSP